jgi:hypothetical protein
VTHAATDRRFAGDVSIPNLARIVSDGAADVPLRVAAARELGLVGTPDAEQALRHRIGVEPPRVLREVLKGLGAIGGPAVLRALARVAMPGDAAARRQLTWARALIAHRHAIDGTYLPAVAGRAAQRDAADTVTLTAVLQTVAATAKDRARLTGGTYGIELAPRSIGLVCGRTASTLFFNRELDLPAGAARLGERPWIVALVARWRRRRRLASIRHVILATPARDGVRLEIVRTDGERIGTGRALAQDGSVWFSVAGIMRSTAAPIGASGWLTARRIELEGGPGDDAAAEQRPPGLD